MSDTDLVQNSEEEEEEHQETEDEIEVPSIALDPRINCKVNTQFKCPLEFISKHTLANAQNSAQQGCPHCILRTAATTQVLPDAPSSAEIQCSHNYIFLPFYVQEQRIVLASEEELHDDEHQLICDFYGDRIGGLGCIEQVVPCNTDSRKSLDTVKRWLSECDEGHDCMQTSRAEFMPRRLLDLRNNNVRLHETTSSDRGLKYACLSHCWGIPPATMLRTTPATFTTFSSVIPWDTIPPTFQDAISFARKLSLPFLWIDALCIIQNDAQDWQQQSSAMADIYQGAYLTLAATSSPNAGGGCYTKRTPAPAHRSTSPLLTMHSANRTRHLSARRKFPHDMSRLPLLRRAWVYQERILSPRVLHFADEELVWECQHAVTCECRGANLEHSMERARISLSNDFALIGPHRRHPAPLDLWFQIVDEYTNLGLKFASDMLPALSGIAKAFAGRGRGEYVAGMWRGTLVREVLWYRQDCEGGQICRGEVRPWRAPSWSWVSREWPAEFRVLPTTREVAQVLDVSCQPAGVDPTGELEHATLTLRTRVLRARFEVESRTIDLIEGKLKIPRAIFQETSYILSDLSTGYLDFDEQHQSDIVLAQIAECSGDCRIFLTGLPAPVHVTQKVRTFMLLAKREEKEAGWRRIGLAMIAAYEPDSSSFACLTSEEKSNIVRDQTKYEIPKNSEETAERKRALFQRLDDSEMQDLIVW